ncbi:MAG: 4Fe-4S binding protein [Xanthobacteraceae bacterium]|nr:4Fe-4S binding protein [Xanthobacteraceae bacterium]
MPLDAGAIGRGCQGAAIESANHLCRAEIERFSAAAAKGGDVTVACTQETPVFSEVASEQGGHAALSFVNIRESAGWSKDAKATGPKMAALIAAASVPMPEVPLVPLTSEGVILVYGRDEKAIEAAKILSERLDVTVLLTKPGAIEPLRVSEFPVAKGTIVSAHGYLGAFELTVDDYALPAASSRGKLDFAGERNGAKSRCDLILDLTSNAPLFPAHELRDGYLRADPNDPAGVLRAVMKAADLVGTFDKPRYITFTENLCAHSRSKIVGCNRCLNLCPTGAITPNGDHVAINENICAGCGACAAVCPTGAAAYALPPVDALIGKIRALLSTYRETGGANPVLLLHDGEHGLQMIEMLARHGDGLPANVLPVQVNEVTQTGLETFAAAFAYGAMSMRILMRAKPKHETGGTVRTISYADTILRGLGFGENRVALIETDDPDELGRRLYEIGKQKTAVKPASFVPAGRKRDVMRLALRELQRAAPAPVDVIALPEHAPFGKIEVNAEGCTLCLACVSACPTGALSDNPEKPMLKFAEDACVQCGLCKATCPEKVISLHPQIDFRAATAEPRVMKEEEPFECIRCSKPFGTKSTIERISAKLEGRHWMFQGRAQRLDLLKMCEDCRVIVATEQSFDPHEAPMRPAVRTTDDYLREREEAKKT